MAVQTNPSNRYLLGVYLLVVLILSYILQVTYSPFLPVQSVSESFLAMVAANRVRSSLA